MPIAGSSQALVVPAPLTGGGSSTVPSTRLMMPVGTDAHFSPILPAGQSSSTLFSIIMGDDLGAYDGNGGFIAPYDGLYQFCYMMQFQAQGSRTSGGYWMQLALNGTTIAGDGASYLMTNVYGGFQIKPLTLWKVLTAGDTLRLTISNTTNDGMGIGFGYRTEMWLTYWGAVPAISCLTDDFNRTVASGWGTGGLGAWTSTGPWSPSVNGADGLVLSPGSDTTNYFHDMSLASPGKWDGSFTMTTVFTIPVTGDGTHPAFDFIVTDNVSSWSTNHFFDCYFSVNASGNGEFWVEDSGGMFNDHQDATWTQGSQYNLVFQKIGTTIRAKVWKVSTAEPDWLVTGNLGVTFTPSAFIVEVQRHQTGGARNDVTVAVDYITFCT